MVGETRSAMNRSTALLLAVAALLAHTLAIHHDAAHRFAGPCDGAYASFRIARNWAQLGDFVWNPGVADAALRGGLESYPSLLWLWMMGLSEWLHLPTQPLSQLIGILSALGVVVLSARFATDRIAGIVTPVLLVASGGLAAAASSGTEIPLVALLVTASFVSFEHRWNALFVVATALLVAARAEALLLLAGFLVLAALERVSPRRDGSRPTSFVLLLPAAATAALGFALRDSAGHSLYGRQLADLFAGAGERSGAGMAYVLDVARTSIVPVLLVAPLLALALGRLSGAGLRALGLGAIWTAIVVLQGGGPAAFGLALVPGLPLVYLSIQQGMILGLDTGRRALEVLSWAVIAIALALSALASKFPGNLGPLKLDAPHREWMHASVEPDFDRRPVLGRLALDDEVRLAAEMRALASFLNSHTAPDERILTPYPGLLGYASGILVEDLYGRTQTDRAGEHHAFWRPPRRVDWVAAFEGQPDLVLPGRLSPRAVGSPRFFRGLVHDLMAYDVEPNAERATRLQELIEGYELLALPVTPPGRQRRQPVYLLRRRESSRPPRLELGNDRGELIVRARAGEGPLSDTIPRLAWLQVVVKDERGRSFNLTPIGELVEDRRRCARAGLLIDPQSAIATTLYRGPMPILPDGHPAQTIQARLVSPNAQGNTTIGLIGSEVEL